MFGVKESFTNLRCHEICGEKSSASDAVQRIRGNILLYLANPRASIWNGSDGGRTLRHMDSVLQFQILSKK